MAAATPLHSVLVALASVKEMTGNTLQSALWTSSLSSRADSLPELMS